jgi:hypothetical protein
MQLWLQWSSGLELRLPKAEHSGPPERALPSSGDVTSSPPALLVKKKKKKKKRPAPSLTMSSYFGPHEYWPHLIHSIKDLKLA